MCIATQQTAEILGPGAVHRGIDDDMAGMPGAQILRLGGKPRKAPILPSTKRSIGLTDGSVTQWINL